MRLRAGLWTFSFVLCLAAGLTRAQYVEDSVEVPGGWVGSLTYNSKADVVYGVCEMENSVFAIYCPTNVMFRNLAANDARCVAYDSIDNKAFASCGFFGAESLEVIDGQNHILLGGFSVPGANVLVWEPTRNRLYVTCTNQNRVAVVDCASDSLVAQIAVGAAPIKLHLNTRHDKLYVQNYDGGSLSVIALATNQVVRTIQLGGNPDAGYYAPHVDKYYCPNESHDAIAVIDGLSDSIVARVPIMANGYVHAIGGNDTADLVLAEAYNGPTVLYAIDAISDTILSTMNASGSVWSIGCGPATGYLYCASTGSDSILVVDPASASTVGRLAAGAAPFALLPVPLHGRMYLGHLNLDKVYVIRDSPAGIAENGGADRLVQPGLTASPNPFTTSTELTPASPETPVSTLVIFNSNGREVRRLDPTPSMLYMRAVVWDGANDAGDPAPAGVYVARLVGRHGAGTKLIKVRK